MKTKEEINALLEGYQMRKNRILEMLDEGMVKSEMQELSDTLCDLNNNISQLKWVLNIK